MDGAETARQICALEDGLEVKIAAVGASVFADERNRVLAAGLDDFEAKPYRSSEIFHCMACQLGVRYHRIVAVSFFLIGDLDSPRGGLIHVAPQKLLALSRSLSAQ